jgi:hypothetical protein
VKDSTQIEGWIETLRRAELPTPSLVLALRSLGMSAATVGRLLECDDGKIRELEMAALAPVGEINTQPTDINYPFDIEPLGVKAIEQLLASGELAPIENIFTFSWVPVPRGHVFWSEVGPDGKLVAAYEKERPEFRLETQPEFFEFCADLRQLFMSPTPRCELIVLLPLPLGKLAQWTVLQPERALDEPDDALRLITSLSSLGLGYRDSGHRTKFFSNLVWGCQMLCEKVGVGGAMGVNRPQDTSLRQQTEGLANDTLVIRKSVKAGQQLPKAKVFAADFSNTWQGNPDRYADWLIRDRAQDVDEMTDSVMWAMTQTSGICLRLSLPPRLSQVTENDIKILAPKSWMGVLSEGLGHQRGKKEFRPYLLVREGKGALLYIDEPPRYSQLKTQKNEAG